MSDPLDGDQPQAVNSAATRHLCAGVYENQSLRYLIIRKIYNDSRRRVAPSYGFDLVPVVRHAWWAWLLDISCLTAMLGCLAAGMTLAGLLASVIVWSAVVICALFKIACHTAAEVFRLRVKAMSERWREPRQRGRRQTTADAVPQNRKHRIKAPLFGCLVAAVAPILLSKVLAVSLAAAARPAMAIGGALLTCGIVAGVLRQLQLNRLFRAETLRPDPLTRRELVIDEQQTHPCVIYRRPAHKEDIDPLELLTRLDEPSPFMGSGKLVNRWLPPMTVQLFRPGTENMAQREYTSSPFAAHKLVERLRAALLQLGTDPGAEHLPGLQVRDRIYVAASDFSERNWLRDGVSKLEMRRIVDDHRLAGHHFLETSVPIADGEIVATVFIRVSIKGRCLSLDVATCALTRTPDQYHTIDYYGENGPGAVLRSAARSVFSVPKDVMRIWRLLEIPIVLGRAWWAVRDRTLVPRRGRSVAPRVALREKVADKWLNAQLDRTTIYDHMKIIEQRILKATQDFLEAHDVDTSVFEKQATNIINSGVLNMGGGQMEIDKMAVGMGAQFVNAEVQGVGP